MDLNPIRTVRAEWEEFWEAVKPPQASAVQKQEMRRAFYAGAYATLQTMKAIAENDTTEECSYGTAVLESWEKELVRFYADLEAGRA